VELRDSPHDVLLLACDGLWGVLSNDEAVSLVRELWEQGEKDLKLIAEELVDTAVLDRGARYRHAFFKNHDYCIPCTSRWAALA